ncbi:MAG: YbjN domain-containing protein, partial [Armatimonadetes bacterium]|nr:YbjN domain-containing protein [Armatimonadota bacterium]
SFEGEKSDYDIYIIVDQDKAIVYLGLAQYLEVPRDHPAAPNIMYRLMEINWELALGKFEWNSDSGEVRLSFTFTTENGLGDKALGAALAGLLSAADKYYIELHAMLEP